MKNRGQNIPLINGFSKLNREQRIDVLNKILEEQTGDWLNRWMHPGRNEQAAFEGFSENYITSYHLPLGVVPNVVINGQNYLVPLVTEESSVIAAASRAAKFWSQNGGFKAEIIGTEKKGQIHFTWDGNKAWLQSVFPEIKSAMLPATKSITRKMEARGGGITDIQLIDKTESISGYFQIDASFETADAMGANFINTCLEEMASQLVIYLNQFEEKGQVEIIMSILSNYTPNNMVSCRVECDIDQLGKVSNGMDPGLFAHKFDLANRIALTDVSRAVTHNKGIYNGVDAVVLATGNDWRAVEACGHACASSSGRYSALTQAEIKGSRFIYTLHLPLAVGSVGGLTKSHPMAKFVMKVLGNPGAKELMMIAAAIGLANNFSAVTALITTGIQQGHMKMHLPNILNQLNATPEEEVAVNNHFANRQISHAAVHTFINQIRNRYGR